MRCLGKDAQSHVQLRQYAGHPSLSRFDLRLDESGDGKLTDNADRLCAAQTALIGILMSTDAFS